MRVLLQLGIKTLFSALRGIFKRGKILVFHRRRGFEYGHRDVIGVQASLGEQLLDVPVRQGKTQIPTNGQKDDFRFELPPLEQTGNR